MTALRRCGVAIGLLALAIPPMGQAQEDRQGCADNPLLSRMSGFFIQSCRDEAFASHEFLVSGEKVPVEGHLSFIEYRMPRDAARRGATARPRHRSRLAEPGGRSGAVPALSFSRS